jgi:hypothetical protein
MTRGTPGADKAIPAAELALLTELGQVEPPRDAVLQAAREVLWSAVAREALGAAEPGNASQALRRAAEPQRGDAGQEPDSGQ